MERKYQIFISSTFIDLEEERDEVIKQILKNYHFPIGMEMFSASDKKQWEIIKRTIDSSDLYILILGFRYGSIDPNTGLSFTEKEYHYALETKKPVIVFVKKEEPFLLKIAELRRHIADETIAADLRQRLARLYTRYYDEDQTRVQEFRSRVSNKLTEFFSGTYEIDVDNARLKNLKSGIDTQSAISKKIAELPAGGWVRQHHVRWRFLHQYRFYFILLALVAISGFAYRLSGTGLIQNQLIASNAELFHLASQDNAEYARVLPDGPALANETSFAQTFQAVKDSFWILTNAFKRLHEEDIEGALRRGVSFRILLLDTNTASVNGLNQHVVYNPDPKAFSTNRKLMIQNFEKTLTVIDTFRKFIRNKHYSGSIEVKFYRRPLYNQMWIKDASKPYGLAHFNITHYDGFKPHFRVTPQTSKRLFDLMVLEFRHYWEDPDNVIYKDEPAAH